MAEEVIRVRENFYILATSSRIDDRTRILKQGDTFAVFDRFGDIDPELGIGESGVYCMDTRFLSRLVLTLEGSRPLLLSSTVRDDNGLLAVDCTNPDIARDGEVAIPRGTIHLFRAKVLWNGACHERLRIRNFAPTAVDLALVVEFGADFADIFEVRGLRRPRRGRFLPPKAGRQTVTLAYRGLDGRTRRTRIAFEPTPAALDERRARFRIRLAPGGEAACRWVVSCEGNAGVRRRRAASGLPEPSFEQAAAEAAQALRSARGRDTDIYTSNEQFNDWLNRSLADVHMMITETPHGPYPYAGVPWFSTPFGRDGIVTALELLWVDPAVARGVLAFLAATQARERDPLRDAQPGKVLHEARSGEMAVLGEVPFRRYYGSVDATPLFVLLAGAYWDRTGDLAFVRSLWPSVERALAWIDRHGDADGDGFVEYLRRSPRGLVHQGWKDSRDAVFHADGTLAEGPIALCEVQGYVFAARRAAARIARALGKTARAARLEQQAELLRRRFDLAFWCEEISTYALALDGRKRPCRVRASNAGHCLFTGIAPPDRARRVAALLMDKAFFSGWGIRTVAATEARYNPMSYHNGSVWPHDNALAAAGFARYGFKEEAARVLAGLLDATLFLDLHRLPELFCGFPRRPGESPTLYPVACAPQAWASGAVFLLLQSCLGLEVHAPERRLIFTRPLLPPFLEAVTIRRLRVGEAAVDLSLTRHENDVGVNVLRREGDLEVLVIK